METKNKASKKKVDEFKKMARAIIRHHFGTRSGRIAFKSSGLTNFVFAVSYNRENFIVRISPDSSHFNLFIKEQWAQERAKRAGIPTSEILEVGMEVISCPFMISRAVEGREAVFHPERTKIVRQMGHYASLINLIPTSGFGSTFDWSSNQLSRCETWTEYLTGEFDYESKLRVLEKHRMISGDQAKALREVMAEALQLNPPSALNHGDLRLKNLIVDEKGKIKAIIDWEGCSSNIAPQWELSVALHDLWIDEKQEFLKGYGLSRKKIKEMSPLIKAFNILNYARAIEGLAKSPDKEHLEQYRMRLSGNLDLYSITKS